MLSLAALACVLAAETAGAQGLPASADYTSSAFIDSRLAVWTAAQLHLMFAAFVLAVPMFAWCI
ncbi:MAG: hypothetical protein ACE5G0_22565, partial [Rhodothermales bacterium]